MIPWIHAAYLLVEPMDAAGHSDNNYNGLVYCFLGAVFDFTGSILISFTIKGAWSILLWISLIILIISGNEVSSTASVCWTGSYSSIH